jgi:hypothetical protein
VGRSKEFPIRLSVRSLPLLPGFAWRNELMIKADVISLPNQVEIL